MKTKDQKREQAKARQVEYRSLTAEQKALRIKGRRGASAREQARIDAAAE